MSKLPRTAAAMAPTWDEHWGLDWPNRLVVAKEVIELSPKYLEHYSGYLEWRNGDPYLDWYQACVSADSRHASSTERHLVNLVSSLVQPESYLPCGHEDYEVVRQVDIGTLGSLGQWQRSVANLLFD